MKKIKKTGVALLGLTLLMVGGSAFTKAKAATCEGNGGNYCVAYPWGNECTQTQTSSVCCTSAYG